MNDAAALDRADLALGRRTLQLLDRLQRRLRPRLGWLSLLLMAALQILMASLLRKTEWVDFGAAFMAPELMPLAGLGGAWWLVRPVRGRSRARRCALAALRVALLAGLGGGLWLQQMTNIVGRWLQWGAVEGAGLADLAADLAAFFARQSAESVAGLQSRFEFWLQGVRGAGAQQDDLILIGFLSLALYGLAVQAAWTLLAGRSVFASLAPSLLVFAGLLFYLREYSWSGRGSRLDLALYLALLFLLFAWRHHATLLARWRRQGVDYPESLLLDRSAGLLAALLLMGAATFALPSLQIRRVVEWAHEAFRPVDEAAGDLSARMFPDLPPQRAGRIQSATGGLPNSFLLGNAPDLSTRTVMRVTTNYPFAEERGFYLRGLAFQHYDGRGWSNADAQRAEALRPNAPLGRSLYPYTREIWQSIRLEASASLLYAIPEVDQFSVGARPAANAFEPVAYYRGRNRDPYAARSAMPLLSAEALAAVPLAAYQEDGSAPVRALYAQLPASVTERTVALAQALAGDQATPYAMGLALERYLRALPYDLDVALPGADVSDVADHFLFDLQRGYCDYYATAFVVLMRSLGVPARFAVGYAPGFYDPYFEEWTFTDAQAHSWPEVWFPGLGWIPFEPTAGRRALDRDFAPVADRRADAEPAAPRAPVPVARAVFAWHPQMWFWPGLLAAGLLAWLWRRRLRPDPDPWAALLTWGRRLGRAKAPWETEREYARGLVRALGARPRLSAEELRVLDGQLQQLAAAAIRTKYAPEAWENGPALDRAWRHLQSRLRRIWLGRIVPGTRGAGARSARAPGRNANWGNRPPAL